MNGYCRTFFLEKGKEVIDEISWALLSPLQGHACQLTLTESQCAIIEPHRQPPPFPAKKLSHPMNMYSSSP